MNNGINTSNGQGQNTDKDKGIIDKTFPQDIHEILDLKLEVKFFEIGEYNQLERLLKEADLYYEQTESREMIERKITRDPESIIVVKNNNKIIGCVFFIDSGNEVILSRLGVSSQYRKRGIGDLLVQQVIDLAKNRGIKKITLFVGESKDNLQKYYEKLGFELGNTYRTGKFFL